MPRRRLKKLDLKAIEGKYPIWLIDLGVQGYKAEKAKRSTNSSRSKLKARNPVKYEEQAKRWAYTRKLRVCGVLPKFRAGARKPVEPLSALGATPVAAYLGNLAVRPS